LRDDEKIADKDGNKFFVAEELPSGTAEEYVEVLSTEDGRIKIIGEELANDTGRAIFAKIAIGAASPNDLAKELGISLPLVNWHINRLLRVGLIKIEKIEQSSKNREMKFYGLAKTVLVIVPPNSVNGKQLQVRTILSRLSNQLTGIISFVCGSLTIYGVEKMISGNIPAGTQLVDPEAYMHGQLEAALIALLGGGALSLSAMIIHRLLRK
jgi:DNA-binding transcriptional ArsR family regulator